jgi:predicted small metal-binding protein
MAVLGVNIGVYIMDNNLPAFEVIKNLAHMAGAHNTNPGTSIPENDVAWIKSQLRNVFPEMSEEEADIEFRSIEESATKQYFNN